MAAELTANYFRTTFLTTCHICLLKNFSKKRSNAYSLTVQVHTNTPVLFIADSNPIRLIEQMKMLHGK